MQEIYMFYKIDTNNALYTRENDDGDTWMDDWSIWKILEISTGHVIDGKLQVFFQQIANTCKVNSKTRDSLIVVYWTQ